MPRTTPPPPLPRSAESPSDWPLPHGSALSLWVAVAAQAHAAPVVLVVPDPQQAWALEDELAFFANGVPVLHLTDWETLPYDRFNRHPRIVSQRIATLQRLPALQRGVLVVPVTGLMQRIAPPAHLASGLCVATGDTLAPADGRRRLEAGGYVADPEALTEEARLRLEAFAAEEELGASFALATHDLEIRGAGELLGEEQSGQIQAIGFGLYARLLERTVRSLEADEEPDLGLGDDGHPVELHLPALIPTATCRTWPHACRCTSASPAPTTRMACARWKWSWSTASACCPGSRHSC